METNSTLELIHILVYDNSFPNTWHEYLTRSKFTDDLIKFHPLLSMDPIWIVYRLSENQVLQLKVDRNGLDIEWKVYNMDRLLFTFNCGKGDQFIKIFETQLQKALKGI